MATKLNTKQAVILAAGNGVRLDRIDTPKPLVKVGRKPMIIWNIKQLEDAGIENIYIVIGFRGEEIKKELTNNPDIKAKINFIEQKDDSKKGMLKSILSLREIISGSFFLIMSDLIIEKNPYKLFESITDSKEIFDILVSLKEDQFHGSGALSKVNVKEGNIQSIGRDLKESDGFEIGVYYFPDDGLDALLSIIEKNPKINNFDYMLKRLAELNKLKAVLLDEGEWFDINTPATHIRAEIFMRNNQEVRMTSVNKNKLEKIEVFSNFSRDKTLKTDIIIKKGLINKIGKVFVIPDEYSESQHFIITDSVVDELYGENVLQGLLDAGYNVKKLVIPVGEKYKQVSEYARLADEIFSYGMDKKTILISLGGGVINNLAGFLASTLYRGVGLIHIPTTMMAQVDATIDFKQAINSSKGKNLLGSYHPAISIIIDPDVLSTLDKRNINNGIAESIKHALTQDKEFLEYLLNNVKDLYNIDFLEQVIQKTVELKVPLLNGSTDDDRNEMLPQYGHSIAHAVEHLSSYNLLHGEALSVGMCVSAEIAKLLNICDEEMVDLHYKICEKYNLPTKIPEHMTQEDIIDTIHYDKHHLMGSPHMALIEKTGSVWNDKGVYGIPVDYEILRRAIVNNKTKKDK